MLCNRRAPLNESPSEKEGKWRHVDVDEVADNSLNESPSEKEGKCEVSVLSASSVSALNESPSEKEGKSSRHAPALHEADPSMKVPPKRKGNRYTPRPRRCRPRPLNESPSEKEGKSS